MHTIKAEYMWLDGNNPQYIRSKTKVITVDEETFQNMELSNFPEWNYDGSSTKQAETSNSELLLIPTSFYKSPFNKWDEFFPTEYLVMCEVRHPDGTPHETNTRYGLTQTIETYKDNDSEQCWFGYEQEYTIINNETGRPLGWPTHPEQFPEKQGKYYCGVGSSCVIGRDFVNKHLNHCLRAGIKVSGINAEVMLAQWEYQVGPITSLEIDQIWVSRYILYRLGEEYNYTISIEPKLIKSSDWNGSGMHCNFSTLEMRNTNDSYDKLKLCEDVIARLEANHTKHISLYGVNNEDRLTGECETASYESFSYGIGSRTTSIRIPSSVAKDGGGIYIEDRRPGSNADPYLVAKSLIETTFEKHEQLA